MNETDSRIDDPVPESLVVLKYLTEASGLAFDPTQAGKALRRAEADIPPTVARAARLRLAQAAEAVGLQTLTRQLSVREALASVEPESPLAIFAVTPTGTARWHLLTDSSGGKGSLLSTAPEDDNKWLDAERIAERIGASDADVVVEWMTAQPAAPLAEASAAGELGHSHDEEHHGPPPLRRLLGLLRPEAGDIWMVIVYALGVGVLSLAVPITAMAVVNTTALATLVQQLLVLCVALLISLCLAALLRVLQSIVVEYLQQRIFVRVVGDLSHRLPRIDVKAFDKHHGPELVNRFFDVLTVQKASASLLLDGVSVVLQMAIGLALLAFYHQILLGFDLALIASLVFLVFVLGRGAVASSIRESRAKYVVAGWVEEMARHPVAFKFNGGPNFARERADVLTRQYLLARQSHYRIVLRQVVFALGLQVLASTALLGLGGYLVINGQLTLGQLVAAEIVVASVVSSFTKLGKHLESYYDLLAAVDKLGHLTDLPLERDGGVSHRARSQGAAIRVHNVTFAYGEGHRTVLDRLNLRIDAGERVALLGPNGAGKSTLVDLLFGLRQPNHGHIEIDETDLRDLRLESLREHIAVVKGIEIFEGSIFDNVRMGREHLSLADVRRALGAVRLLEDVLDLPGGLNTALGTGGAPLSLGQAERLMLARAIAGSPRLLVLDEVLDDMDQDVRQEVLPGILGPEARWTLLVVTHSQDVARLCGRQVSLMRADRPSHARADSSHQHVTNV
ncbi:MULTISPECIES: peptidase domain-containing ABC transporter [unclassified Schlesneria]|uniref:peptidase domain-containing ABC transporter n=1 Tax=Schlesneria TaxID=656899 RepID=UPI0035A118DB